MPKKKPIGWPELMTPKRLSSGVVAYYWAPPTRARKAGCPIPAEALGTDYGTAKERCDTVLNKHYHAWASEGEQPAGTDLELGTFDWMSAIFKRSPKYTRLPPKTRFSYDHKLRLVSNIPLNNGKIFGSLSLHSISPGAADK